MKPAAKRFILGIGKWGMYVYDTQTKEPLSLEQTKTRLNEHLIFGLDTEIKSGKYGAYFMVKNIQLDLFTVVKILNSIKYNLNINIVEHELE